MKKALSILTITFLSFTLNAQIEILQASTSGSLEQKVGLTDVEIEYSRPNMRGRTIFGDLVPYGKIWRTGANKNTTISFSDDVMVNGQTLKAGKYAIYTKPEKDHWEIYFYTDTENWGNPETWDDKKVAAKATAKVITLPFEIETFSISIDNVQADNAKLNFLWSNVYVETEIQFPTDKKVMASINSTMKNNPKMEDYYAAAVYYFNADKDISQAKKWIDQAMEMNKDPKFYQLRQQSLIYAKSGDVKGALSLAQKSLDAAKKAGNPDYVKMNEDSIKEWSK